MLRGFVVAMVLLALAGCDSSLVPDVDAADRDGDVHADAAGARDAGPPDAGPVDAGGPTFDAGPPPPVPESVFFVGNSFTFGGPVPTLVDQLAVYGGFPPVNVEYRALPGQTLQGHRNDDDPDGAPARVAEGWDVVVLQENSLRPTDGYGPADRFKVDATWFYDLAKSANPDCEVVLYETWARRSDHSVYPGTFDDPEQMQAELRFHYYDAAERYVPLNSAAERTTDIRVAPVGDAWEHQLASGEPPRLHADDSWHAGAAGQYLNALVIYGTVFRRRTEGMVPLRGLDEDTALLLQRSADRLTGASGWGYDLGPYRPIATDASFAIDFGTEWVDGWTPMVETEGTVGPLTSVGGDASSIRVTTWGFGGTQTGGADTTSLGLPTEVSSDTLWLGSSGGHAAALDLEARVVVRGLEPGSYRFEVFASRDGTDAGRGRVARYRIGEAYADLDAADNTSLAATLEPVSPDARGEVLMRVGVSPDSGSRYAYLGMLRIVRLD